MKKIKGYIATLILLAGPLGAQAGGFGGFYSGIDFPQINNLKDALAQHNLNLAEHVITYGGGGYGLAGNMIIGGFGYGGQTSAENNKEVVEFSAGGGAFEAGRLWNYKNHIYFALTGAIGGYGYTLKFRPKLEDVEFDSLVENPGRVASLSTGGVMLGLNSMVIFRVLPFISLGLRGSFMFVPFRSWKLEDGAKVFGMPSIKKYLYGLQFMVLFGKVME